MRGRQRDEPDERDEGEHADACHRSPAADDPTFATEYCAGEERTREQFARAGVGAVVRAVVARDEELGGDARRAQRGQRDHDNPAPVPSEEVQTEDQEREEHVELLFDRQGPEVLYRARRFEEGGVRPAFTKQAPVRDVGQRTEELGAQPVAPGSEAAVRRQGRDTGEGRDRGGEEPPQPSLPEPEHVDAAGVLALAQHEHAHEEAREREEQADAEVAAARAAEAGMERDDSDDRDGTDPVEREHMAAGAERTGVSLSSCSLPRIPLRDPSVLPSRVGPNHDRTRRRLARTVGAGGDHADPDHRHQDEDPLRDSGPMTRPVDTHGDDEQPERREARDDRRDPQVGPPRGATERARPDEHAHAQQHEQEESAEVVQALLAGLDVGGDTGAARGRRGRTVDPRRHSRA